MFLIPRDVVNDRLSIDAKTSYRYIPSSKFRGMVTSLAIVSLIKRCRRNGSTLAEFPSSNLVDLDEVKRHYKIRGYTGRLPYLHFSNKVKRYYLPEIEQWLCGR